MSILRVRFGLAKPRNFLIALILLAPTLTYFVTTFSPKAQATIGFVQNIGVANSKDAGTTLVITVPAGGVAAGNSIVVTSASDASCTGGQNEFGSLVGKITSITDTSGNTYSLDRTFDNNTGDLVSNGCAAFNGTHLSEVWSAHSVNALVSGNTITITYNINPPSRAASANEFSGLASSSTLDKSAGTFGSGTAAASPLTATTSQADELVVGAIGVEGPSGDTFTLGSGFSSSTRSGTSGGSAVTNVTSNPEYKIVSTTGTYLADGTLGTSRNWVAVVVTYKAALPTFTQSGYRLFANADSTTPGAALAAVNTAATLSATGDAFRLRILLHVATAELVTSGQSFKLQFSGKSGTCDTSFSGENYVDVTTTSSISYKDNVTPADGVNITTTANDPTHSSDTVVSETYEEANNFTNSQAAVPIGQDGEWDLSLYDNGATAGGSYCLRVVKSDGSALNTYSFIPEIIMSGAVAPAHINIQPGIQVNGGFSITQ